MFVTLSVFGVPYAGITAVLTAICAFVPYVGAFLSCAIGAILASLVAMNKAVICVVVYVITQFIENQFIYPHVVGNSVGLHPGLTLIAVILGERISGLVGMIFAIPMMAVLYTLSSESVQKHCTNAGLMGWNRIRNIISKETANSSSFSNTQPGVWNTLNIKSSRRLVHYAIRILCI